MERYYKNVHVCTIETLSEAVKMLKGEYCVKAIDKMKMDRAIIFCRTKIDCDNLEKYFNQIGTYVKIKLKIMRSTILFSNLRLIYRRWRK